MVYFIVTDCYNGGVFDVSSQSCICSGAWEGPECRKLCPSCTNTFTFIKIYVYGGPDVNVHVYSYKITDNSCVINGGITDSMGYLYCLTDNMGLFSGHTTHTMCVDSTIIDNMGYLQSSNFPADYNNDENCAVTIVVPQFCVSN